MSSPEPPKSPQQIKEELKDKALGFLTPEQRRQFEKMKGEPPNSGQFNFGGF